MGASTSGVRKDTSNNMDKGRPAVDVPNPPPKKRSTNNNRYHCNGLSQSGAVEICHLAKLVARLFFPSFFWPFGSADFIGSSLLVGT
jgi:hypothetical protein